MPKLTALIAAFLVLAGCTGAQPGPTLSVGPPAPAPVSAKERLRAVQASIAAIERGHFEIDFRDPVGRLVGELDGSFDRDVPALLEAERWFEELTADPPPVLSRTFTDYYYWDDPTTPAACWEVDWSVEDALVDALPVAALAEAHLADNPTTPHAVEVEVPAILALYLLGAWAGEVDELDDEVLDAEVPAEVWLDDEDELLWLKLNGRNVFGALPEEIDTEWADYARTVYSTATVRSDDSVRISRPRESELCPGQTIPPASGDPA